METRQEEMLLHVFLAYIILLNTGGYGSVSYQGVYWAQKLSSSMVTTK